MVEYLPNKLIFLYSKIYYKKENYLKVRTVVFKYITPLIVKVWYISNVIYKRAGYTSKLAISKLTKNWKNRTLISRQLLDNN